jgi:hypothetical protein
MVTTSDGEVLDSITGDATANHVGVLSLVRVFLQKAIVSGKPKAAGRRTGTILRNMLSID